MEKEDGKPRQFKKRGFKTKQEAHKAMLELEQSLTLGTYIQPKQNSLQRVFVRAIFRR